MGPIISLLVITAVSLLLVRVGGTALTMTGLPRDVASFQAYSAFFGVGFTTRESEMVVSHPVRRRIVRDLIIAGNLGITAAVSSLIVAFVKADGSRAELGVLLWILSGLTALLLLVATPLVRKPIDWAIRLTLRRAGVIRALDYDLLLHLRHGYVISEYETPPDSPLVGRTLRESALGSRGVVVLGITRDAPDVIHGADSVPDAAERFIGAPPSAEIIRADDVLTVYGREADIRAVLGV